MNHPAVAGVSPSTRASTERFDRPELTVEGLSRMFSGASSLARPGRAKKNKLVFSEFMNFFKIFLRISQKDPCNFSCFRLRFLCSYLILANLLSRY
jgi:hypothetical protein